MSSTSWIQTLLPKELAKWTSKRGAHEDYNLAQFGLKQYYSEHLLMESQTSKKRQLELQKEVGDVTAEDQEEIRQNLKGASKQRMIGSAASSSSLGKAEKQQWRSSQRKSTRSSARSLAHCC